MTSIETKQKRRAALAATHEKRKHQICKVIELKIDESKLNQKEKEQLKMYFVEAKWLYNHILNQPDAFTYDYKINPIQKQNKDGTFEEVQLQYLPAKFKQDIVRGLQQNIKTLAAMKKTRKVGKLKFKSEYNTVVLSQYGDTHKVTGKNRIKIAGIKRHLFVRGLHQIAPEMEFANAKLMQEPNGYYIKLTTYQFPQGGLEQSEKKLAVGLDFGIKDNIVTSDGAIFNVSIAETDRLKRLQRKFARAQKGSNNRNKLRNLIAIEYQKIDNKKKDASNKIVHNLLTNYHHVFLQDEQLHAWKSSKMKGWGRKIQHSCLGSIKAKLRLSTQTTMLGKFVPTTKMCPACGEVQAALPLEQRTFSCSCGYQEDRDVKAAKLIRKLGLIQIGMGHTEFTPVEKTTPLRPRLQRRTQAASLKQEASSC